MWYFTLIRHLVYNQLIGQIAMDKTVISEHRLEHKNNAVWKKQHNYNNNLYSAWNALIIVKRILDETAALRPVFWTKVGWLEYKHGLIY